MSQYHKENKKKKKERKKNLHGSQANTKTHTLHDKQLTRKDEKKREKKKEQKPSELKVPLKTMHGYLSNISPAPLSILSLPDGCVSHCFQ